MKDNCLCSCSSPKASELSLILRFLSHPLSNLTSNSLSSTLKIYPKYEHISPPSLPLEPGLIHPCLLSGPSEQPPHWVFFLLAPSLCPPELIKTGPSQDACMLSHFKSHPTLYDPMDCVAYQAPLPMGSSRQEYWSRFPFPSPGDLPESGMEPASPALAG